MAEESNAVWVNVKIDEPELVEALDQIVKEEDSDRSKVIRKLIRQEYRRRNGLPTTGKLTRKQNGRVAA